MALPPNRRQRFPRTQRLRRATDFQAIYKRGARRHSPHLTLIIGKQSKTGREQERARLAVVISRKVGGAVVRNQWRRRLRDIFRRQLWSQLPATDYLVIVKAVGTAPKAGELRDELVKMLIRS